MNAKQTRFPLLLLLLLLLLPCCSLGSPVSPTLDLVVLGDSKNELLPEMFAAGIIAARQINARPMAPEARAILGKHDCTPRINLRLEDHGGNNYNASKIPFANTDADGIIGPAYSYMSTILAPVALSMDTPVLSYWSTSPILNSDVYSNFFRTIPDDSGIAAAMIAYLSAYGINHANVAYTDDPYGEGLADAIQIAAVPAGVTVKTYPFARLDTMKNASAEGLRVGLAVGKIVAESLTNVWILVNTHAATYPTLLEGIFASLKAPREVHFIFSETMYNSRLCTLTPHTDGSQCISEAAQRRLAGSVVIKREGTMSTSEKAQALLASLANTGITSAEAAQIDPSMTFVDLRNATVEGANKRFDGPPDGAVAFFYDAVYAYAVGACLQPSRPSCCKQLGGCETEADGKACLILKADGLVFSGVSGTVKFNSVGSRNPATAYVTLSKAILQSGGISPDRGAVWFEEIDVLSSNGTWNNALDQMQLYAGSASTGSFLPDLWCGIGKYGSKQPAGSDNPQCGCCSANQWTGVDGVHRRAQCEANVCPAGEYLSLGRFVQRGVAESEIPQRFMCTACPPGQYSDGSGAAAAFHRPGYTEECGDGHVGRSSGRRRGLMDFSWAPEAVNTMSPGSGIDDLETIECTRCPVNTYSTASGANSSKSCVPCPAFHDSDPGSTICYLSGRLLALLLVPLALVIVVLAWLTWLCVKHRLKYAVVKVGPRRCFSYRWRLDFPRRSRFTYLDISEGAKLGNGAFGEVNEGTLQVGTAPLPIAVKHVLASKATELQRRDTIIECHIQCELSSPFVVKCFGFATGPGPEDFSILLELMELGDLPTYMCNKYEGGGRISEAVRLQWMIEIAAALEYVHACGLIHADVAARNLCLCHRQNRIACKLTDFGMSRRVDPELDAYLLPMGQPVPMLWAAPECLPADANFKEVKSRQVHKALPMTQANDVWSFGVTMWEIEALAATGEHRRPYSGRVTPRTPTGVLSSKLSAKALTLDFDFPRAITTSTTVRDVASHYCLRIRPKARGLMSTVRCRLQEAELCRAEVWGLSEVQEWLLALGAPRDAKDADLFTLHSYDVLCKELLDDKYRPDYIDPEVHEAFTVAFSNRVVLEIKGLQTLVLFAKSKDWPEGALDGHPQRYTWMTKLQKTTAMRLPAEQRDEGASSSYLAFYRNGMESTERSSSPESSGTDGESKHHGQETKGEEGETGAATAAAAAAAAAAAEDFEVNVMPSHPVVLQPIPKLSKASQRHTPRTAVKPSALVPVDVQTADATIDALLGRGN